MLHSRQGDESEEEGPQLSGSSDGDAPKPLSNSGAELQVGQFRWSKTVTRTTCTKFTSVFQDYGVYDCSHIMSRLGDCVRGARASAGITDWSFEAILACTWLDFVVVSDT
jgi:hypothetical protein